MKVCFLKLSTGEEIVCKIDNFAAFDEEVALRDPLRMQYIQQDPIHMTIGLTKWLPFLDVDIINIKSSTITIMEPAGEEMIGYYQHCLENENERGNGPTEEEIERYQQRIAKIQKARESLQGHQDLANNQFTVH
jgi:hypothetical protein